MLGLPVMGVFSSSGASIAAANPTSADPNSEITNDSSETAHADSDAENRPIPIIRVLSPDSGYSSSGDTTISEHSRSSSLDSDAGSEHLDSESLNHPTNFGNNLSEPGQQFLNFASLTEDSDPSDWTLDSLPSSSPEQSPAPASNVLFSFHKFEPHLPPRMHAFYDYGLWMYELTLHPSTTVSWTWNGSHPSGIAAEIKPGDVTVTSHRGNDITKTGSKEDPAVHSE